MSYEIVKSISLKQKDNGFWCAIITSACNNVYPRDYCKWEYDKKEGFETKEELQKEILLDFYYGNFHGGTSTKYGKFLQFLGGSWGCKNENSRACKTYHFYDKLRDKLRNDYLKNDSTTGYWEFGTPLYEKYCTRNYSLKNRQDRELKNALYKEFLEFKPTCKPTILRLFKNNEHVGFVRKGYGRSRSICIEDKYCFATQYTNNVKINFAKDLAERSGYKVELIEV